MTSTRWFRRFAFAYGPAFAVLYVVALKLDLALFTVYPTLGLVFRGTQHAQDAAPAMGLPAMYWYGWTATAALGALIVAPRGRVCPSDGRTECGRDGRGWSRRSRSSPASTSPCLGFDCDQVPK